jgi:hypothetical protein
VIPSHNQSRISRLRPVWRKLPSDTSEDLALYAVEIELWQIDTSKPALRFNVFPQRLGDRALAKMAVPRRSFGRPDHPSTGVDVDSAAGGDVEATPLPRQPTFGSPDSRKEPPESAKRNKTRGEISRKYGVNCSRSVADPRSGANKPRILEPVRTILKKSDGCLRHKSCCPDQTWNTGKR